MMMLVVVVVDVDDDEHISKRHQEDFNWAGTQSRLYHARMKGISGWIPPD
jgi:hypothetical protein